VRAPLFLATLLATLGGCSALIDFQGLAGDTGSSASDGSAAREGGVNGDASTEDAGADDAAPDVSGSGPRFCATVIPAPSFCADFDEPDASTGDGWDMVSEKGSATVALDTTQARSQPRSLHAVTADSSVAENGKRFSVSSQISVDFDVYYTSLGTNGPVSAISLTPVTNPGIVFFARETYAYFQVAAASGEYSANFNKPGAGQWHHVSVTIKLAATGSTISGSFDGKALWTDYAMKNSWGVTEMVTVSAGITGTFQQLSADVYVDNVVVNAI
jgi:hypothetical protein